MQHANLHGHGHSRGREYNGMHGREHGSPYGREYGREHGRDYTYNSYNREYSRSPALVHGIGAGMGGDDEHALGMGMNVDAVSTLGGKSTAAGTAKASNTSAAVISGNGTGVGGVPSGMVMGGVGSPSAAGHFDRERDGGRESPKPELVLGKGVVNGHGFVHPGMNGRGMHAGHGHVVMSASASPEPQAW